MKILQLKLRSIHNTKPQLFSFLIESRIDIACISETFLDELANFYIPG